MSEHHGRYCNVQSVRAVQSLTGRRVEERRLDAELNGRAERRGIDADIASDSRGHKPSLFGAGPAADQTVNCISEIRKDKGHIEAIGAESQNTAVPEKQCLYQKSDRHRDTGRIRAEKQRDQRSSYRMSRRATRQRNVEHHCNKGECRSHPHQRHLRLRNLHLDLFHRVYPDRNHYSGHHRTGLRAQIIFWNVHERIPRLN